MKTANETKSFLFHFWRRFLFLFFVSFRFISFVPHDCIVRWWCKYSFHFYFFFVRQQQQTDSDKWFRDVTNGDSNKRNYIHKFLRHAEAATAEKALIMMNEKKIINDDDEKKRSEEKRNDEFFDDCDDDVDDNIVNLQLQNVCLFDALCAYTWHDLQFLSSSVHIKCCRVYRARNLGLERHDSHIDISLVGGPRPMCASVGTCTFHSNTP